MAKKKIKIEEQTERDKFTVVLENIQSDFKVFGEQLDMVEQSLKSEIKSVEFKLDAHIEYSHSKFENIETELSIIRNDLKEKVSREEFRLLETKVHNIEKRLNTK